MEFKPYSRPLRQKKWPCIRSFHGYPLAENITTLYSALPVCQGGHSAQSFFFLHCRTSARHGRSTTGISMWLRSNFPVRKKPTTNPPKQVTKQQHPVVIVPSLSKSITILDRARVTPVSSINGVAGGVSGCKWKQQCSPINFHHTEKLWKKNFHAEAMLPMDLHAQKPFRHGAWLQKWLNVRCLFAYPELGTVEPLHLHQMPLVKLGVNKGGR